jgi:glycosyltransferase involved in cell wall biosynthesis
MDHREVRLLAWLRAAPAVIVHSEAARRRVAPALPDVALHVVPHFCFLTGAGQHTITQWRDAARDPARDRWMADMAFSGPAFVLVSLGFPTADKQLERVIAAIARLPPPARSVVALLVAGEPRPGDPDLMAVAARHGCADRVRVLGWLAEAEAERLLLVADLVLALRFPTRGESSGAVARALGLGCAVLVSDHGAHAELPDAAVIKLPPRRDPTEPVRALLAGLIADRSRIARTRAAAFAHANTVGDAAAAAARHARIARGEAA